MSRLGGYHLLDVPARQDTINYLLDLLQDYQPETAEKQLDETVRMVNEPPVRRSPANESSNAPKRQPSTRSLPPQRRPQSNDNTGGLDAPLTVLSGIGQGYAQKIGRTGFKNPGGICYFIFPRRYADYTQLKPINRLEYGEEVTGHRHCTEHAKTFHSRWIDANR